ncbi:MAG: chemotaxis protein CheX [Deltaproteobacteria bacterium]|nr:chemotaxis protein CheX [Deltaproteobacteria bacterium]
MDVELVNPFIEATLHVLRTMSSTEATPGKPYVKKDQHARGDVTGVIGLTGEASGTISVSFTEDSIIAIVSRMFGEKVEALNGEIKDAVGEITNMISGQARQKLEEMGKLIHGAIPSVIVGKDHSISHFTSQPVVAVPFETKDGGFTVEICIED